MLQRDRYELKPSLSSLSPNVWDTVVLVILLGLLAALAWGATHMASPYQLGETLPIDLSPAALPQYTMSTVLRMFIAMGFSLLFTFIVAPFAAKNIHAERFIMPFIDIAQSIPVLGMQAIAIAPFILLFPNSLLGPECAAIFAIFTAQVWNMALSLYQSLKTVPKELIEAAKVYQLSSWQRFWRIEVPHATPPLLWNTMMSMSAGWFFVVASEAISVSNQYITLPGIGSYISVAIHEKNISAIFFAILTMFIVILAYDQLLFRPLLAWAEKFKTEIDDEDVINESWFFDLLAKTRLLKRVEAFVEQVVDIFVNGRSYKKKPSVAPSKWKQSFNKTLITLTYLGFALSLVIAGFWLYSLVSNKIPLSEIWHVIYLGLITAIKVFILIILSSLIWVPIGAWIGLNPRLSAICQPLIQFLAAFPANLFYPLAVLFILKFSLNVNVWTTPLMILGTQWYILFNVIAGASSIPKEVKLAAKNFGVKGWLWWKRLMLPAIFPHYVTGAMAAAGGCWNASVVAEAVQWGDDTLIATGLGSYITEYTGVGDFPRIALGIAIMCLYVMLFNRLIWHKLYRLAETRFSME